MEERGHLLVAHVLDAIDPQERGLAPEGLDLLHKPREKLGRLGGLGQQGHSNVCY